MDPELKYTQIQVNAGQPQLLPIIDEEPDQSTNRRESAIAASRRESAIAASRRESIAIHPTCDCNTCCCYFCCGCTELYTPAEMTKYNSRMTLCPLTSKVINPVLAMNTLSDEYIDDPVLNANTAHPAICLFTPITLVIDLVSLLPRCAINICSAVKY